MEALFENGSFEHKICCVDMHTTGEPTRIIYAGYPTLDGTLLEQRAQANKKHDHIRRRLMFEPRGHYDMYGAVLRPKTELVESGEADIGVLFLTNDGYSTMCGHATIALGRFLLDLDNSSSIFPNRRDIKHDVAARTALIRLHAPCGLLHVTVPTNDTGMKSDPLQAVSFISVPSFATGINVQVPIPEALTWPELRDQHSVHVDFAYGGAFYCFIPAQELGFPDGLITPDIARMDFASKQLKAAINANPDLRSFFLHPDHEELGFLYSIMIVDKDLGAPSEESHGAETGLCFFAEQQVDRSPTGSAVQARIALALAKSELSVGEKWTYHSPTSNAWGGKGAFIGSAVDEDGHYNDFPVVKVRVEGFAYYTGDSTFIVETTDPLGDDGFLFGKLSSPA